jgi:hypothetical protein
MSQQDKRKKPEPTVRSVRHVTPEELAAVQANYPELPSGEASGTTKGADLIARLRSTVDNLRKPVAAPVPVLTPAPVSTAPVSRTRTVPVVQVPQVQPQLLPSGMPIAPTGKPVFKRAICIITKNANGLHIILRSVSVSTTRSFFRIKGHTFMLDVSKAFMVSNKGVYLLYDIDIAEPIEQSIVDKRGQPSQTHVPVEFSDNVHYSEPLDLMMHSKVFEQAFRALGEGGNFNLMTIMMFIIGALVGAFASHSLWPSQTVTVTTATTITTTATTHLIKFILQRLR